MSDLSTKHALPGGWIACSDLLPERGVAVETKVDDGRGVRNVHPLKLDTSPGSKLWFQPDGWTYVYYVPTHWRPIHAS